MIVFKIQGCFSQTTILTMVFKLCLDVQTRWKKLYGFNRLAKVVSGVQFINSLKAKNKIININRNKAA